MKKDLQPHKFLFDCSFEPKDLILETQELEQYSADQINQAKVFAHESGHQTGYQRGHTDGYQKGCDETHLKSYQEGYNKAYTEIEEKAANILEEIKQKITQLIAIEQENRDQAHENTIVLSSHILHKTIPSLLNILGHTEILDFIKNALSNLKEMGQIKIYTHPDIQKNLYTKMKDILKDGSIILKSDTSIEKYDCKMEWINGGKERLCSSLMNNIDQHLDAFLSNLYQTLETPAIRKKLILEK